MNPEPRPSLVSICTTDGARFAATAAIGSSVPVLVPTVVGFGNVAVVALLSEDAVRTIVVDLLSVARATAYPLAASDTATSAASTGDRRRRGDAAGEPDGPVGGG